VPNIDNQVRRLRFESGEMSQQALADAVGVTRQTIIAIEKNKYSPSLEVAFKIAQVFECSLEQVFSYQYQDV
jgi:putative transcriptional regulator